MINHTLHFFIIYKNGDFSECNVYHTVYYSAVHMSTLDSSSIGLVIYDSIYTLYSYLQLMCKVVGI